MSAQRNAPCPCGSGKKYKHCCMPKDELLQMDARIQEAVDLGAEDMARELARQMFARGMAMIGNPEVRKVLMESAEGYVSLLHRAGETAAAVRVLEDMAAEIPERRAGWRQQAGLFLIRAGEGEAGLRQVEAGLREDEADPWLWAGLVRALLALHRAPAALDAVGRGLLAANWAPEPVRVRVGDVRAVLHELASEAHYLQADPEAAERSWQAALQFGSAASPVNVIRLWIAAGQPGRAERWLGSLPADEGGAYLRGLAVYGAGGADAARQYWGPLLRRPPQRWMYDEWWVEAQLLAGDRAAVAAYLDREGLDDAAAARFFRQVAGGERPAADPDPVRNWLARVCLDWREAPDPAELGPARELLGRLVRGDDTDPVAAARRAHRRHGDKLVAGLLAALDGPRGVERVLAEACLKALAGRAGVRSSLEQFVADPGRAPGARGTAHVILADQRGGPDLVGDPGLLEAAMHRQVEGMADLLQFQDYPLSNRSEFRGLPAGAAIAILEALPVPAHPAALAFFSWVARDGRSSVRAVAERRLRQGLAGATDAGHWLGLGHRLLLADNFAGAAPCLELAAHLLAPGDPLRDLALWQWAEALLQDGDVDGMRGALRRLTRESGESFWAEQAELLREGVRGARRRGGAVRLDTVGQMVARLARGPGQEHRAHTAMDVRDAYLSLADRPPPHLDQPAAWAAALLALATALDSWEGIGPLPRWARHLPPAVRAARAPEAAARAVAAEVWRVLDPPDNREWLAAALGLTEDPEDPDWDGEHADDPFGDDLTGAGRDDGGDEDGRTR